MPFGLLAVGAPGAGKSTLCQSLKTTLKRPVCLVNLDFAANNNFKYDIDVNELLTVSQVMDEFSLGPNGALLYCMEYLEKNLDWLLDRLHSRSMDDFFIFDTPGQAELFTTHDSLRQIILQLTTNKMDWRLCTVNLADSLLCTDASKYLALLILSLKSMLHLELPHINVLSKVDILKRNSSSLNFPLDFYTQVQDLTYILPLLDENDSESCANKRSRENVNISKMDSMKHHGKLAKLSSAIIELVEDFGLVGFLTLNVDDKFSLARLVNRIDKSIGYYYTKKNIDSTRNEGGDEMQKTLFTSVDPGIDFGGYADEYQSFRDYEEFEGSDYDDYTYSDGDESLQNSNSENTLGQGEIGKPEISKSDMLGDVIEK